MTTISVCLVGKDGILKEGVKSLLVKTGFYIAGDYDEITDMPKDGPGGAPARLIACIDEGAGDLPEKIRALKTLYAGSRVVVISSRTEMPVIMSAFAAGVDGYILKDTPGEEILKAFERVRDGAPYLSHELASEVAFMAARGRTTSRTSISTCRATS